VLVADQVPYPTLYTHNAGACKFQGKYLLLFRAGVRDGVQKLGLAKSDDGYKFSVEPEPVMVGEGDEGRRVYDARITQMGDTYYITYGNESEHGVRGGIAATKDFRTFERISLSEPDSRNHVLFPEKIGGHYVRLTRPFAGYGGNDEKPKGDFDIWISYSPDLVFWGKSKVLLSAKDCYWGLRKIGPGAPPIKTKEGWLEIFHGVDDRVPHKSYRLGCMLLDLEDPSKIIGRAEGYILEPEPPYDIRDIEGPKKTLQVVFTCGAILEDDGEVKIYYGAADRMMCLATAQCDDLVALCRKGKSR
jgi:beta-1,4-mannooligosaccharide/beta-1,4-mannosyl-N-acetylglucosamine phosphorylase